MRVRGTARPGVDCPAPLFRVSGLGARENMSDGETVGPPRDDVRAIRNDVGTVGSSEAHTARARCPRGTRHRRCALAAVS